MRPTLVVTMGALLVSAGCSMAPKYARPAMPVPPALPEEAAAAAEVAAKVPWQEFITDERLRSVVDLVLANNRDLRSAALNAERVGAYYRIQRSELFPTVGAGAMLTTTRVPSSVSASGTSYTATEYSVGLAMTSWELDIFGRIRSLKEEALNRFLAAQQMIAATRISLIAATASAYYGLAADAENRELARSTLDTQQQSLDLIRKSRDAGVASDLDVRQAETQVEAARAEMARYTGLVELDRHTLELLAGAPVPDALLPARLADIKPLTPVSAGLSSEILLGRPDILAAEFQLKAANADIGAARAAFFPRISLTGQGGLLSGDLSDLFKAGARSWTFTPQVVTPIYTAGSLKSSLQASELGRDIAVADYEKAIQTAFREACDSLTLRRTLVSERTAQEALVQALDGTYRLSDTRYKAGIDSYLGVLVAQRSLFGAQQALIGVRLAELQNLVNLYKVLGGGV
jgi:multidrug efflux system outer membrane protein